MNEIIRLENVEKEYFIGTNVVRALAGASLKVKKGDFIAIVGPSGSGKSTMMNMIGALDVPSKGEIYLEDKNIAVMTESELAQIRGRKIGFVFQNFNLIPTLTAKENVSLPMIFQGVKKADREDRADDLLRKVGLGDRMDHLPGELSGGQKQRVAIARALANNPELILADEPTGNLDSKTGEDIMKLFKNLNKDGTTVVLITHDINVAKNAGKVLKMKDGRFENGKSN